MELRGLRRELMPAQPKCRPVQSVQQQQSRVWQTQAGHQRSKRGLASAGGSFQQDALTLIDCQIEPVQDRPPAVPVAEDQIADIEHLLPRVLRPRLRRRWNRRGFDGRAAGSEQIGHQAPGDTGLREGCDAAGDAGECPGRHQNAAQTDRKCSRAGAAGDERRRQGQNCHDGPTGRGACRDRRDRVVQPA